MALTLKESIARTRTLPQDSAVFAARAELLSPEDRELIQAVFVRGQTARSLAVMAGLSSRAISNRVKRLADRMASREFINAARALPYLEPSDATLASLRFCAGLSERKLADKTGLSPYTIRRRLDRISAQIAMINRIRRTAGRLGGHGPVEELHRTFSSAARRSK